MLAEKRTIVRTRSSLRSGFTLIEMLSVVVILAIVAMVAVPELSASDEMTADAAARVLVSDLLYAQSQAIATQQMQYVSFTSADANSSGGYGIYAATPLTTPVTNPVSQKPYTVAFGSESEFENAKLNSVSLDGTANTVLAFDELGQPYAGTTTGTPVPISSIATITLQSGARTLVLSIEPDTGNITLP